MDRSYYNGDLYIEDGLVVIRGTGINVPPDNRQAAAQAVAGDGYRIVAADVPHGCHFGDSGQPCGVCGEQVPPEWERELLEEASAKEHLSECAECGTAVHIGSDSEQLTVALAGLWRKIHRSQTGCAPHLDGWRRALRLWLYRAARRVTGWSADDDTQTGAR